MVATRRQVQTGQDEDTAAEQNPDLILRKKSVRGANAKPKANPKAETKPKTTRGKKLEPEPEPGAEVSESDAPATRQKGGRPKKAVTPAASAQLAEEPKPTEKPTRAAKTGSVRSKRGAPATEQTTDELVQDEPKPTRSTKAGSVRGRKAVPTLAEEAPAEEATKTTKSAKGGSLRGKKATVAIEVAALPLPEEPKPARQTRGAAAKPQPLSPKKITQVSKAPARNTRNANQKPPAKAAQKKEPVSGKSARKRTVSDENADVPEFDASTAGVDGVVGVHSSTPKKITRNRKQGNGVNDAAHESDASMSSRPTTPTDSPAQSLNTVEEDDEAQDDNESEVEAEPSVKDDSDGSEDELAGPKTPMKRSSLGAQARYLSSVQHTIKKYEDEMRMETPHLRFAILGSQRGTPQTEKPYCKPTAPTSGTKSMTVTRGAATAFVFKDLRDGRPSPQKYESVSEQDEVSFLPDDDIIPNDTTPTPEEPIYLESQPESVVETEGDRTMTSASAHEEDEADYVVPADVQKYSDDPDDTVIIHDIEDDAEVAVSERADSFQTEDTVVIDRPEQAEVGDEMSIDENESDAGSVIMYPSGPNADAGPTTEKMTEHSAILVNFDEHLTDARTPPEDDAAIHDTESQDAILHEDNANAVRDEEMDVEQELFTSQGEARRQTVNFNEFIDVAALSEPTTVLDAGEDVEQSTSTESDISLATIKAISTPNPEANEHIQPVGIQPESSAKDPALIMDIDVVEPQSSGEQGAVGIDHVESAEDSHVPHYALPTIAFEARRKSLPVLSHRTPVKDSTRPNTSDGASMPRIANPFANAWWARPDAGSTAATPLKARPSTSHAMPTRVSFGTPMKTRTSTAISASPVATPKERYPLRSPRRNYEGPANTVAAPVRFHTPSEKSPKRRETFHKGAEGRIITKPAESVESTPAPRAAATPKERFPILTSRANYEEHAKTVTAPVRFHTPSITSPKRRQTFHKAASGAVNHTTDASEVATPVPSVLVTPQVHATERYPRLRPRPNYAEHAKTVAGPVRFQTPVTTPLKRPATGGKSDSLRKTALMAGTPVPLQTPMKSPLKAPAATPSQVPMTPHPAAPLRGVVAVVEVFTLEGASASAPFVALLHRLGAKTTRSWSDRITHVIFKDGSPLTLRRVRLNNREFEESGKVPFIHCVNSRWVTDCDTAGARVGEFSEEYVVDVAEIPRGGKRRRKSMEPAALLNLGGNIVRDRKSSLGRNRSLSRSPYKVDSLAQKPEENLQATPEADMIGKENSGDEQGSPATPAWIAAPGQLVQQTAPMKRVRKLELQGKEAKNRRLTFWNGGA